MYTCAYTNARVLSEFSRESAGYRHSAKHTDHVRRSPVPQDTVGDCCGALVDTGLCAAAVCSRVGWTQTPTALGVHLGADC